MDKSKLLDLSGITEVIELTNTTFLHPTIQDERNLYMVQYYDEQRLVAVREREMNNSDGSEWTYPGQTKVCAYLLSEDEDELTWYYLEDIEK